MFNLFYQALCQMEGTFIPLDLYNHCCRLTALHSACVLPRCGPVLASPFQSLSLLSLLQTFFSIISLAHHLPLTDSLLSYHLIGSDPPPLFLLLCVRRRLRPAIDAQPSLTPEFSGRHSLVLGRAIACCSARRLEVRSEPRHWHVIWNDIDLISVCVCV